MPRRFWNRNHRAQRGSKTGGRSTFSTKSRSALNGHFAEPLEPRLVLDSTVVFNELMYHPTADGTPEWIELYNQMAVDMDLTGWSLQNGVTYNFPAGTILPGRGYLVVAADAAALQAKTGFASALNGLVGILGNEGETVQLVNNNNRVMNELNYGDDGQWPVGPDGSGATLAKIARDTAVDVPQNWATSRQVGGTPGAENFPADVPVVVDTTLLTIDANWKYNDTGSDLGAAWRATNYNDNVPGWTSGTGLFYDETAALPGPKNTQLTAGRTTYYFRTAFQFTGSPGSTQLKIRPILDDGAVYYLNGVEVYRQNMPAGAIDYNTLAISPIGDATQSGPFLIDASGLTVGTNVLSVEVHQASSQASYSQAVLNSGPVAFWHLEESTSAPGAALDSASAPGAPQSGPQHGTFTGFNAANLAQAGPRPTDSVGGSPLLGFPADNRAPDFQGNLDGGDDVVLVPDDSSLNFSSGKKFTLEAWVKGVSGGSDNGGAIITKGGGGGGEQYAIDVVNNAYRFFLWNGQNPNTPTVAQSAVAVSGNWQYVVGRFDQSQGIMQLYVDGVLAASVTPPATIVNNSQSLSIGARTTSGAVLYDLNFRGKVDEVAVYNRALTPAEISAHLTAARTASVGGGPAFDDVVFGTELVASQTLPNPSTVRLAINEIAPSTDAEFWAEIINFGASTLNLGGYVLSTHGLVETDYVLPAQSLASGERLVLSQAATGLHPSDGDKLFLYAPNKTSVFDGVTVRNVLRGRSPEATGSWLRPSAPTPGTANTFAFHNEIVINEVMYHHRPGQATPASFSDATLLPIDATWKYDQSGADLGTVWKTINYDDSGWASGPALLYNESSALPGPKNTPLALGPTTYYFRTQFQFNGNPNGIQLLLDSIVDDGAVYYLNGTEVYRQNMADGPVTASTPAYIGVGNAATSGPLTIPAANLQVGTNVLAVEVHQAAAGTSYQQVVLSSQPVSYWRMEETSGPAIDAANLPGVPQQGAQNATYTDMAPTSLGQAGPRPSDTVNGQPLLGFESTNKAPRFQGSLDGANDVVLVDDPNLNFATTRKFSLEAWVKGPSTQEGGAAIMTRGPGGGEQFLFDLVPNYRFVVRDGAGVPVIVNAGGSVPNNTWQYVVAAFDADAGIMKLYVNGVEVASAAPPATLQNPTAPVSIGSRRSQPVSGYDLNLDGSLDEVAIYNRALSAAEVAAHYNAAFQQIEAGGPSDDVVFGTKVIARTNIAATTYNPSTEEWIELYNRSAAPVDLGGWQLKDAVQYTFAPGTVINPGQYLVVARDAASLAQAYPNINIAGSFSGSLASSGERILLDDAVGNPADEVHYYEDGRWPEFADGGGSSLELRDPRADNSLAESWAASNEGAKSQWQTYSYRGISQNPIPGAPTLWKEFALGLLANGGEFLIDDVSVVEFPSGAATQLIQNGSFSAGTSHWRILGNHQRSFVEADPTNPANQVLHVVASGPTEYQGNQIETTLANGASIIDGREYEISYKAKWLGGSNQLNTRLYFDRLPATTLLQLPTLNGTPGAANSRLQANIGPTYEGFKHGPVVPAANQLVTVSVVATDPDGVANMTLWYSTTANVWNSVTMNAGGGGFYAGNIPGFGAATVVQFYVEGTDALGAKSTFPAAGRASRALYKVEDGQALGGTIHNFRIIMTAPDTAYLHLNTNVLSNERLGATVIYDEKEVFYDVGARLKGSFVGRDVARVGFNVGFHSDQLFRGMHHTVGLDRSAFVGIGPGEIIVKHLANEAGGIPGMYDDIARIIAPNSGYTSTGLLQMGRFEDDYLDTQFENGSDGNMYELEVIRYTPLTANVEQLKVPGQNYTDVDFQNLGDNKENYRWDYLLANNRARDDFGRIIEFAKMFSLNGQPLNTASQQLMDVDEWMRAFAHESLTGIADAYGRGSPHNLRLYVRPEDNKVLAMPWDWDAAFLTGTNSALLPGGSLGKLFAFPANVRLFYGHLRDLITSVYNTAYLQRWTQHYGALAGADYSGALNYVGQRAAYATSQLPAQVPFVITTNGGNDINVGAASSTVIGGDAWINVKQIFIQGRSEPLVLTWSDLDSWQATIPLEPGQHTLNFQGYDFRGNQIVSDSITVTNTLTGTATQLDNLRITEVMYHPVDPPVGSQYQDSDFEFIELRNIGSQSISLTGAELSGGITFSFGNQNLAAGQYALVVANKLAFESRYGTTLNVVGEFGGSLNNSTEQILLTDSFNQTILDFTYFDTWAPATDGTGPSLVIIDPLSPRPSWSNAASWRASNLATGSPGLTDPSIAISGRHVFYNDSVFDGQSATAGAADDAAIATDKVALRPGTGPATFANYTSYIRGINGLMVDVDNLVAPLALGDFSFRIGNDNNFGAWTAAPVPISFSSRALSPATTRFTILWDDSAIKQGWLQVTVNALGLIAPDVFYFGNAVAESGNSVGSTAVDASDEIGARNQPRTFTNPAPVDDRFDFNRDAFVNAADQILARSNATNVLTTLTLISPPAGLSLGLSAAASPSLSLPASILTDDAASSNLELREFQSLAAGVALSRAASTDSAASPPPAMLPSVSSAGRTPAADASLDLAFATGSSYTALDLSAEHPEESSEFDCELDDNLLDLLSGK